MGTNIFGDFTIEGSYDSATGYLAMKQTWARLDRNIDFEIQLVWNSGRNRFEGLYHFEKVKQFGNYWIKPAKRVYDEELMKLLEEIEI